jgi:phosphatidylglycerol---prolipoprotein diacylglyceryl transferase
MSVYAIPFPSFLHPVAFSVGPIAVHWYGIAYYFGLLIAWRFGRYYQPRLFPALTPTIIDRFVVWVMAGVVIGGRLGHFLFYAGPQLLSDPLKFFRLWEPGMSFHGGLLGVIAATALFSYRTRTRFLALTDITACTIPIGLFLGRCANFINQELCGRPTEWAWGVVFPALGDNQPHHASQLYEALTEGPMLWLFLLYYAHQKVKHGILSAVFLLGYSTIRIFIEQFFRMPEGMVGPWTYGQVLCLPMLILGAGLILYVQKQKF